MKSFNHNADLLRFATEGLTTLLAMQLVQGDVQERDEDLLDLAGRVVDTVWQQVPATDIEAVVDAEEDDDDDDDDDEYYEYCFCKEG